MVTDEWRKTNSTIEDTDTYSCSIDIGGQEVQLDILDTPGDTGEVKFTALLDVWIRTRDAYILVYDIQSKRTFEFADMIWRRIRRIMDGYRFYGVLVGNKSDLYDGMQDIDRMNLKSENIKDLIFGYLRMIEQEWKNNLSKIMPDEIKEICILYVGNSIKIEVTAEMGQQLADSYFIPFIETSAKTGSNVKEAFKLLITQ